MSLTGLTLCGLLACETKNNPDPDPEQCALESGRSDEVSEERAAIVEDNGAFAWDLYHQVREDDANLFFSPISISAALDMTRLGARGETLDEMAALLGGAEDEVTHHAEQGGLLQELDESDTCGVTLDIANRIFAQDGLGMNSDFTDGLDVDYGAPAEQLDYVADPEAARVHINEWVADNTADKIPELLAEGIITMDTRLVLANAIYMKADWAEPFEADRTQSADFTRIDGSTVSTPMMRNELEEGYAYASIDGAQLVELPYEGDELSMVLVVPDEADGLLDLEPTLNEAVVQEWFDALSPAGVSLQMPSLEMRWSEELSTPLKELGMQLAFESQGDFTGITDEINLFISAVVHEAYVKIDEEGTEAAAATAVVAVTDSAPAYHYVTADHPFLFMVRDRITDSVLFIGRVADPTAG
jgi:serpin B